MKHPHLTIKDSGSKGKGIITQKAYHTGETISSGAIVKKPAQNSVHATQVKPAFRIGQCTLCKTPPYVDVRGC